MTDTSTDNPKAQAHALIDTLPEDATWDDILYRFQVRQSIEAGIIDMQRGHTISIAEIRWQFGCQ